MLSDSFRYAINNLTQRKLRTWLTVIGIFIGIASVVALISLGDGLRDAVAGQLSGLGADRITVQPKGAGFGPPGVGSNVVLTRADLRVVQRAEGVLVATGRILQPVTVNHDDAERIFFLTSIPDDNVERQLIIDTIQAEVEFGRMLRNNDRNSVLIGDNIATDWPNGRDDIQAGEKIQIAGATFDVVGILESRGIPATDQAILMNEEEARELLNMPERYQFLIAKAETNEQVDPARAAIEKDLRSFRGVDEREEDFTVETSQELLESIDDILAIVTGVLAGIAAISLLVGGIGIMNTMYTAVVQRTGEIGIMKAIGATNGQVLQLFIIEAGLLGLVGGLLGVTSGAALAKIVEFGAAQALGPSVLQAKISPLLILGSLAFGFLTGVIAGVLPARQASRLPPVEALRG